MDSDVSGVRIIPSVVEFNDTDVNTVYRMNVTVKNVSKTSKSIRYYGPNTKNFTLKVKNPDKPVAPGLEVPAVVEFVTEENVQHNDRMVLTVDDDVIEIPLKGTPSQPQLVLEGPVDFGHVTANSKVINRQITLHNNGSKAGDFKIKYSGDKPITFIPSTGNVPAQSAINIRVEYVTKLPGKFDEIARVKLEGQESGSLHIRGTVVDGSLQLLDPQTNEHLSCIKFGATYYGTDCTQTAVLYNHGPEPVCFVTVLDEGAEGQELGTDLTKSTSGLLLEQTQNTRSGGDMNDVISLVTAIPNQGVLGPYQRVPIFFRFSPRWTSSQQGFNCTKDTPPRKDFALFMHLKMVGASHGFQSTESHKKCNVEGLSLEIAVTGTALPVLLTLMPQIKFDFGECPVGEHVDQLCTLQNESPCMPITYQLRRVAHYTAKPTQGKIRPGEGQNIIFTFAPSQVGTFRPHQYVDVLGQVADNRNPLLMHLQVIHSQPIQLLGRSNPATIHKQPVFNPGITPKIANEVGLYVDSTLSTAQKTPAAALLGAQGTNLHHLKSSKDQKNENDKTMVAFPNDRACSIRPSDRSQDYKTIFTRMVRHTYVDPDYAYTEEEQEAISAHKQYYIDFIEQLRESRRNKTRKTEFKENDNAVDIAIKPAAGLRAKKLKLPSKDDALPDGKRPEPPNKAFRLLSIKELAEAEKTSSSKVKDGLNAVPTTAKEKADCSRVLSPQELHQIVIGPPMIDFGQVCLRSITQKDLNIVNNLDQYIHVVVNVECRELRQTSPLSQVVPPHSKATLPLIFESNSKGRFQRSLDYKINGFYKNHLTVFAEVVPVALELSTSELILEPVVGLPLDAGRNWSTFDIFSGCIRGVVTLSNKLNHVAEFTWQPILGDRGTAFSIRPATGIVDAGQDLDCEVVFHPSYMAPEEGLFNLNVHTGNTLKLKCLAKMGKTNVQFMDRRIMFGQVPLHLTSTRTAMLKNNSLNHAYFQVLDPNPFPGLTVSPLHGVVPVGGTAELKVHLTPNAIMKFDTRVQVSIRGWKTLELRMGGTVEPPCVDIDVESFNFGGVYCSSSLTTPFRLLNRTNTKARMEFDLSRYTDFSLEFPRRQNTEDYTFQLMNPGVYSVTLDPDEIVEGNVIFKPTEVASYDFIMPVTINQTGAPTPAPTPFPPTPAPSNKNSLPHIVNPRPQYVTIATPRRKVIATALRQPLTLSSNVVDFSLSPGVHEVSQSAGVAQSKGVLLVNNSDVKLKWTVDTANANQVLEDGIFKFVHANGMPFLSHEDGGIEGSLEPGETFSLGVLFCPNKPGHYNVTVPVIVNEDYDHPYQFISLVGELKAARLWFDPMAIVLTPVPLMTDISTEFNLLASNYTKSTHIRVEVPEAECEDGSIMKLLSVTFLEGKEVKPCCGDEGQVEPFSLPCRVTFKSPRPVSFNQAVYFIDDAGNRFPLTVAATADNCLMTCYPYVASSPSNHQIVCEQGATLKGRRTASRESVNVGEAILVPCASPVRPASRPSTTATSSNFEVSSSSYEDSSQSNLSDTFSTPRDGALNKFTTESEQNSRGRTDAVSRQLGSAIFPEEDTEEGIFHTEVLLAVQRWFSSQGWPGGPHPISVPQSLRSGLSKKPNEERTRNAKGGTWDANNVKKEFKTVYDMITHLSGKPVPGIPINNALPVNPTERAKQVYWQHATLLTYLRAQGASVSSIKPEYLMEPGEYKTWVQLQKDIEAKRHKSGHRQTKLKTEDEESIEEQLFEAVSKRAWTDVLLQLLKTLVLSKVTPRQFKNIPSPYKNSTMPMVDPDPLCSNVYSIGERIILLWLNHHYEQKRTSIWENSPKGGVPPSRWVVNFDFDLLDGLVLAAVIGAHAPFVVKSHLHNMYTHPATAEQCLHNALKVVNALSFIGIDYDIQAIDITDPNPIALLLLCLHLYSHLPSYVPKSTVDFSGGLHATVLRQVRLSNPSAKPLIYQGMIAGRDGVDFTLPKGNMITIPPKSTHNMSIEFLSRFLRPAEAVLVLVGRRQGSSVGSTLVFNLRTQIDNITPKASIKCESPCYELYRLPLEVTNPFPKGGDFNIVLVESRYADTHQNSAARKKKLKKKIRSRTDHGQQQKEDEGEVPEGVYTLNNSKSSEEQPSLCAFFCPKHTVHMEANGTSPVELHFLPFQVGRRQCSLIFVNEEVGEFLYSVDAMASLPVPAQLPFRNSMHSVRITSAAAAGNGRGYFGGEDNVVYWKCEVGQMLNDKLSIPINNQARENALLIAAKQHMSETEIHRRRVTGTLDSATVTANTISLLSSGANTNMPSNPTMAPSSTRTLSVELDSDLFSGPPEITLPNPTERQTHSATSLGGSRDGFVDLPLSFCAQEPGHYPCRLVLSSDEDIRVYLIECTVTPEGSQAEIEFIAPTHQAVTQDIPIVNQTNHDWPMEATTEGVGFCGPTQIIAKAFQTSHYPLLFRPQFEGTVCGKLMLHNTADGVDHTFHLKGKGEQPLPLEQIVFHCQVKQSVSKRVNVPNVTRKKLHYRVESDLPFISGDGDIVTVLPGKTIEYDLKVSPLKRGSYKGVLAFIAGNNPLKEVDSDGDELPETDRGEDLQGYRVWYSVEVHVEPQPPEKTLNITCACQKKAVLELGLSNPSTDGLCFEVEICPRNVGLQGCNNVALAPQCRGLYELTYAPAIVGQYRASLIFYNETVGEFWYDLNLCAEKPCPTTLPYMECELGRWARQYITLNNPTEETLMLIPTISNTNNFLLERENERPIELRPHSSLKIPLTFMPSTLGTGQHSTNITFHCEQMGWGHRKRCKAKYSGCRHQQLGEWVYYASGSGRLPQPQDPVSITAMAGSNSTLIIPFRNPLDVSILVDVVLADCEQETRKALDATLGMPESPFCLLLKHAQGLRLSPKSSIEIPISFAPEEMKMFEGQISVVVRREDCQPWLYDLSEENPELPQRSGNTQLSQIVWVYPIRGYPELTSQDKQPAVIMCQARDRKEERLEVTLSGVAPSAGGPKRGIKARAKTPADTERPEGGIVVGEGIALAKEFSFELVYGGQDTEKVLEPAVALSLVRQERDKHTGLVVLVFNVIYAPYKSMVHDVQLLVKGATGGIWRFPLRFVATEPNPDDTITVEAVGLDKESTVGFRLSSQNSHPSPYSAYFVAGSDIELSVTPQTGELLPAGSNGTLIKVGFTPSKYGKTYQGKLVVQTPDMQWTYNVRGVLPEYTPPRGRSSQPMGGPHPDPRRRLEKINYIRDNLRLATTAVSSPIKGAPVIPKHIVK